RQELLLAQRDTELGIGLEQLGINVVQTAQRLLGARRRVVADGLVVHRRVGDVRPIVRLGHLQPAAIPLEAPLEQPLGLLLLGRDQTDDVLAQALRRHIRLDVGDEAVLVFLVDQALDGRAHECSWADLNRTWYSQALQPLSMCSRRSTSAPSTSARNRASAAQISGNRSATAGMAQLCSVRVPLAPPLVTSAMYPSSERTRPSTFKRSAGVLPASSPCRRRVRPAKY